MTLGEGQGVLESGLSLELDCFAVGAVSIDFGSLARPRLALTARIVLEENVHGSLPLGLLFGQAHLEVQLDHRLDLLRKMGHKVF